MPLTKGQFEKTFVLFERFVEAHEAIAEALVMNATPTNIVNKTSVKPKAQPAEEAVAEASNTTASSESGSGGPDLGLDLGEDDGASTAGTEQDSAPEEVTQAADDTPSDSTLDLTDKKAVEEFRVQITNVLKEYAKECKDNPAAVPDLLEEVCDTRRFAEVKDDQLEELHDSAFDAIAALK